MGLKGTRPQMSGQLELPLGGRDETPNWQRSEEVPMAAHETGRSGDQLAAGHLTIHFLNRPVRTRMPGGVAGDVGDYPTPLCRSCSRRFSGRLDN